jgi:hypothetical protein
MAPKRRGVSEDRITVRLSKELKEAAQNYAEDAGLARASNVVRLSLMDFLKRAGYIKRRVRVQKTRVRLV